jgi:phosphonatase-like hydrolase
MSTSLVCLDMAGTTVSDDGTVMSAFAAAMRAAGLTEGSARWSAAEDIVMQTMGQSKIEVFTRILGGDESAAADANAAFERAYDVSVANGEVNGMPGASDVLQQLRRVGIKVCLTTGFAPTTRDAIIDRLRWRGDIDLALSPADAGRGRPWPDMILEAARRLDVEDLRDVAVVGDTVSDIEAGREAGAGLVIGVMSGHGTARALKAAGADEVMMDVTGLPRALSLAAGVSS